MAGGLRFTKDQLAEVKLGLGHRAETAQKAGQRKAAEEALGRIEQWELLGGSNGRKKPGLSVRTAITAFHTELGERLVLPPNPGPGWWAQMQRRLSDLGVTEDDCGVAARTAGVQWRGMIKAESLIRQADTLLAVAQRESSTPTLGGRDMEDL